jgi:hypothetical protein
MRRSGFSLLMAISTMALLAGSTVGVAAQSETSPPTAGALATGQVFSVSEVDFTQTSEAGGSLSERGRTFMLRSEMSDARLSGDVVIHDNADRWYAGSSTAGRFLGDLLWGTTEITNEGGSWVGTSVGTTDTTADGAGVTYHELVGSGDYQGLSAVIFEREVLDRAAQTSEHFWNAVIFPGPLPPDR